MLHDVLRVTIEMKLHGKGRCTHLRAGAEWVGAPEGRPKPAGGLCLHGTGQGSSACGGLSLPGLGQGERAEWAGALEREATGSAHPKAARAEGWSARDSKGGRAGSSKGLQPEGQWHQQAGGSDESQ